MRSTQLKCSSKWTVLELSTEQQATELGIKQSRTPVIPPTFQHHSWVAQGRLTQPGAAPGQRDLSQNVVNDLAPEFAVSVELQPETFRIVLGEHHLSQRLELPEDQGDQREAPLGDALHMQLPPCIVVRTNSAAKGTKRGVGSYRRPGGGRTRGAVPRWLAAVSSCGHRGHAKLARSSGGRARTALKGWELAELHAGAGAV